MGFGVIMMFPYRLILGKKCTTLVSDTGNGGGSACVGTEGTWEISVSFSQFCYKPITALKIKVLKKSSISVFEC